MVNSKKNDNVSNCPNCGRKLLKDKKYCNAECQRKYYLKLGDKSKDLHVEHPKGLDADIVKVLEYIGIDYNELRRDAYNHWLRFISFCKKHSGEKYSTIRSMLRSWIGIDFRYIDAYFSTCLDWGIIKRDDVNLIFIGIPKEKCQ